MKPLLKCIDISYQTGGITLLSNISLEIVPGEMLGLIGPNGAGKTTLLRCLSGYYAHSAGEVYCGDSALEKMKDRQRAAKISYITQEHSQGFPFSVMEILQMGAFPHLLPGQNPGKKVMNQCREALDFVNLTHLADREFNSLSGGEKQLVLFARTLVQNTEILLLDEPTSNLDLKHEQKLLSLTRELCSQGRGAVTSIHNLDRAAQYCDRLLLLSKGKAAALGTPEEVLNKELLEQVFDTPLQVYRNYITGSLGIVPE